MSVKLKKGINTLILRASEKDGITYDFSIKSKQTNESVTVAVVDLTPIYSYLTFIFELATLQEGEYNFEVKSSAGKLIRDGIAYLSISTAAINDYNVNKTYKVYERSEGE